MEEVLENFLDNGNWIGGPYLPLGPKIFQKEKMTSFLFKFSFHQGLVLFFYFSNLCFFLISLHLSSVSLLCNWIKNLLVLDTSSISSITFLPFYFCILLKYFWRCLRKYWQLKLLLPIELTLFLRKVLILCDH